MHHYTRPYNPPTISIGSYPLSYCLFFAGGPCFLIILYLLNFLNSLVMCLPIHVYILTTLTVSWLSFWLWVYEIVHSVLGRIKTKMGKHWLARIQDASECYHMSIWSFSTLALYTFSPTYCWSKKQAHCLLFLHWTTNTHNPDYDMCGFHPLII